MDPGKREEVWENKELDCTEEAYGSMYGVDGFEVFVVSIAWGNGVSGLKEGEKMLTEERWSDRMGRWGHSQW
ncbi:hypothetical protein LINPERPRIM_LOCUS37681 [Linum perenne]